MPTVTVKTKQGEVTYEDVVTAKETDDGRVRVSQPASGGEETRVMEGSIVSMSLSEAEERARSMMF